MQHDALRNSHIFAGRVIMPRRKEIMEVIIMEILEVMLLERSLVMVMQRVIMESICTCSQ